MKTCRLVLLIAAVLMLTACGGFTAPTATPRPPLIVSWTVWPGYYPLAIAQQQGLVRQTWSLSQDRRLRRVHNGVNGICFGQSGWK